MRKFIDDKCAFFENIKLYFMNEYMSVCKEVENKIIFFV